jgi:tetratricopeptide (TPR) repeat protein
MNHVAGQSIAAMPLGEALAYADLCRSQGRLAEAEAVCRQILAARPDAPAPAAEHLLGVIALENGKVSEAIEHVERAIELAPNIALFHANVGEMYRLTGRPKLAAEAARRAIEIEPKMAAALSNLGVALYELKKFDDAADAQRSAIAASPNFAEAYSNLGNALHALHRFDEAVAAYRHAIALKPNFADAWANLGTTLHHGGDFSEGVAVLRHAIALAPHHANAHTGLALLLLMRGDFGEGWDEYEWRLRSTEVKGPRFPQKPWQGESLAGKHIYLQAEQGFGDALQFARYLPLLAARAARVTIRVQQELVTLLRESLPNVTVLGDRGDPAPYQCDAALVSLPRLLRTRLETIPAKVPYLRAPGETVPRWQRRLAAMAGVKVGVAWAGKPDHINDHRRSVDIALLAPLLAVRGASFASLQVGPRAADLRQLGKSSIDDLAPQLADFAETAAAVHALDLLITVDTSLAHAAGALGKPVWVLLPWVADWRWMLDREDNPWYPNMRLFRQNKGEQWPAVIARVAAELKAVVAGDVARLMPFKAHGERRADQAAAIMALEAAHPGATTAGQAQALSPGQALVLAQQKRVYGFLADAADLAGHAAAAEPANAEAVHLLGLIAHQSGKLDEAIEHLRRATTLAPDSALYHANLGEMCRLAGRIDEALAAGRRALECDPDHAGALSNVGIALFERGKFDEAIDHYDRAIAVQADFALAHSNRGNALQRLKRFAEAEQSYRRAIELLPTFADGWNNLGTCLREMKRLDEAEATYRKSLELAPNKPDTLDNLALAVKDLDRLEEAAQLLRRALAIDAHSAKIHVHYGLLLLDQYKIEEAAAAAERAFALDPNGCDVFNLMGRVAFERGDPEAAVVHYRRALALKPDLADAHNNMGNALKELGQLQNAQAAYLESLRLDPNVAGTYVNLAETKTFMPGDAHLTAMESLAGPSGRLTKTERMHLDFAFGKAYGDLKDYQRSFTHWRAGNAAKRAAISYDEKAVFDFFDNIEAAFTPELIRAKSGGGDPSDMPVFVIGMPRSGTTLIEQIIASHPRVHGAGELHAMNDAALSVRGPGGDVIAFPDFAAVLNAAAIRQLGSNYVANLRKIVAAASRNERNIARVTDKMPSNYYFAGLIHLVLPNAIIIHAVRDPVDTCLSCFSKLFAAEQNHTYELGELGRYYKRYQRLMAHWRRVLPPGRIFDVRYEDVVADLEGQARRIVNHCNLPWDDRCLAFHETDRVVRTASATQVRRPIYNSAIGRWRAYERHLEPLLTALGER